MRHTHWDKLQVCWATRNSLVPWLRKRSTLTAPHTFELYWRCDAARSGQGWLPISWILSPLPWFLVYRSRMCTQRTCVYPRGHLSTYALKLKIFIQFRRHACVIADNFADFACVVPKQGRYNTYSWNAPPESSSFGKQSSTARWADTNTCSGITGALNFFPVFKEPRGTRLHAEVVPPLRKEHAAKWRRRASTVPPVASFTAQSKVLFSPWKWQRLVDNSKHDQYVFWCSTRTYFMHTSGFHQLVASYETRYIHNVDEWANENHHFGCPYNYRKTTHYILHSLQRVRRPTVGSTCISWDNWHDIQ